MTERKLRAVLDTNVVVAAFLSKSPTSPTAEIIRRWRRDEFKLLYSWHIREEYAEKLLDRKADPLQAAAFLGDVDQKGICVALSPADVLPLILADPDDDIVLACAIVGRATHLVTYDPHIHALGEAYQGVRILDGLHFLYVVRGGAPPNV